MQRISSEFVGFVRDTGIRALDRLTTRAKEIEAPLRPVLRAWSKLSNEQKSDLFDQLIATVQTSDAAPAGNPSSGKSSKRDIRRFDPEEAEATLPAKPRKKSASPKKKKR
ncbi:MAG: hypothetical protein NVSMB68_04360 [Thermoanaerobaculia bacterium]